jgi:uncharacterized protein (DUF305 family)
MPGTLAAVLASVFLTACGAARATTPPSARPSAHSAAQDQPSPAAVAEARADSLRHPYTAADIRFMTVMIGHHAQAIEMARMAPSHGASASVQTLAERIINSQRDEIATMQRWLRARLQPVPEPGIAGAAGMHGAAQHGTGAHGAGTHGAGHEMAAGMLTAAQMKELDEARGKEFDRLFLVYMIQHHRGAVAMVKELFGSYGAGQDETVFKLASDVNVDQLTEIARMERMLVELVLGDDSADP